MDMRNDTLYSGDALAKIFGDNVPDHIMPVPDAFAKEADNLLGEKDSVDVDMTADTPLVNWAKEKKMYAWIARYKGAKGTAVVIEATPIRAKNRFHDFIQGGKLEDVRLTNQVPAIGMTPDVITDPDDPRIEKLRSR